MKVIITEYKDCLSLKYSDIPEKTIDRETNNVGVRLGLLNGKEIKIDLAVKRKKNGTEKVVELLLPKNLSEEEIDDIADLYWYVFPKNERGRKLLPLVSSWERNGTIFAACLSERYGLEKKPFARQQPLGNEDVFPDPARVLCWWPDLRAWETIKEAKRQSRYFPVNEFVFPFYSFNEWFKRSDMEKVNYAARGKEYARYIRRLRTMLLYCQQKEIRVKLTAGNVETAHQYFERQKLDPAQQASWTGVVTAFKEMPEVLLEKKLPCGPIGVLDKNRGTAAVISYYSHLPEFSSIDCVGVCLYSGDTILCNLFVWPNPLAGEKAYEKAGRALFDICQEYGVKKIYVIEDIFPFEAHPEYGDMFLRFPGENSPVKAGQGIGLNDPCPCGSGIEYKKCCGKNVLSIRGE